jgi:Fic family protein
MDYLKQLKGLQKATGKTQTELAALLKVSFPTLNSWINKKSEPRESARERINLVYQEYFGVAKIEGSEVQEKWNTIKGLQKKFPNPLQLITSRKDLYDSFVLELTYHTNSIEGSTLNEPEVKAVIFDNATIPDKTVTEHQEAKNHQAALGYLFQELAKGKRSLTEDDIKKLHSILMNGIWPNAGQYRHHAVRIAGSNVVTANPVKVPPLVANLVKYLNKKPKNALAHLAKTHAQFEQIHPFSDGNGRVGRLLMVFIALRDNLPPVLIKRDKKQAYYTYLERAQTTDHYTFLESFVGDGILESYKLLQ